MTSTTRTRIDEKQLAAFACDMIEQQERNNHNRTIERRSELVIELPGTGTISIDQVWCVGGEVYIGCESKLSPNDHWEQQCIRAVPFVNVMMGAYVQPKTLFNRTKNRLDRLTSAGVGRVAVVDGEPSWMADPVWHDVDTSRIARAFNKSDGSIDPPAGTAAGKRATESRTVWQPLKKYLDEQQAFCNKGQRIPMIVHARWSEIKREIPTLRRFTSAQCVKAIDAGECIGVGYTDHCPRRFISTGSGK